MTTLGGQAVCLFSGKIYQKPTFTWLGILLDADYTISDRKLMPHDWAELLQKLRLSSPESLYHRQVNLDFWALHL